MAILKPAPSSVNSSIAFSRLAALGVTGLSARAAGSVGPVLVPAHPAAKLVQVGQAVLVGLVDEDRVGVGNVQPALDDRRRHQDVGLRRTNASMAAPVLASHLAVADGDPRLGHDRLHPVGDVSMLWTRLWTK